MIRLVVDIKAFLEELSTSQLQSFSEFIKCIETRARGLNKLAVIEFERRANMTEEEVVSVVSILQKLFKDINSNNNLSEGVTRVNFVGLAKDEDGEQYVNGLVFIPTKEIGKVLSSKEIRERLKPNPGIFYEGFDYTKGELYLTGEKILMSRKLGIENNAVRLLQTLTKDINKEWFEDEILEEWEGVELEKQDMKQIPKNRVYNAAKAVNDKVAIETEIQDFLIYSTKKCRINPRYLKG